ncbi:MAG: polysaccharide biosynthesis tyrosine autokinase [Chitinophagaceae bacterium]
MKQNTKPTENKKNMLEEFMFRYFPYWPLFLILVAVAFVGGYIYLRYATPVYEINATLLIKDEKKGADDSKMLEALNIYSSTKLVENEIEVIKSKELLKDVITNLSLYGSIYEHGKVVSKSAYNSSPVIVKLQKPEEIKPDMEDVHFSYNNKKQLVKIEGVTYPLNTWVKTPFGTASFVLNPNKTKKATNKLFLTLSSPNKVLGSLANNLSASPASKLSTVINLRIYDEVPARGEDILNNLIEVYNKAAVNDKNILSANTLAFVNERIGFVSKELDSIETKLQNYRSTSGVVDLSEEGKLYLQSVGDNDRQMTELNMQSAMLDEVDKYIATKDNKIGIVPSVSGIKDPMLSGLLQNMLESQMQYERMEKTIPGGNPAMFTLRTQIDNLRPAIQESINNQRLSLNASKNKLGAGTGQYASILRGIPKKERDLLAISRQQAIKSDAYSFLLQKREETALSQSALVSDSRTINHATATYMPVSPVKFFIYLVSVVIALLVGFAYVLVKEMLTNKIQFRADVEKLTTVPVVAEVIKLTEKPQKGNVMQLSFLEQFRQLRTSIALNGRHLKHRKILITSSIAGEGKSFIANNLARSLSITGKKVVLLDMDLRHPKITTMHDLNGKKGVADVLENKEIPVSSVIYPTASEKISVIPAGYSTLNPTELLLNGDLNHLFQQLEADFDFVLIDTCPIDPVTDAFILSEYCDSTVYVVRHNYTPKSMVEMLEETHKMNALKNLSIVFNGIRSRGLFKKQYGYGYGYGRKKVYGDNVYRSEMVQTKI